jgi:protein-S-isoprenylcysteine O-methyltransferase Ste14
VHLGGIRFGFLGNVAWLLIPPLLARINTEENLLRTEFGDEYKAYCSHTSRLIPGIY